MTVHFVGLKLSCHVSSHFSSAVSSANNFDEDDIRKVDDEG